MVKVNRDKTRLSDILSAIEDIDLFSRDTRDKKTRLAIERNLEIIGEAAQHLSTELKNCYSNVPWKYIIGMRNILIHEYMNLNENIIWSVVDKDISELKNQILTILNAITQK